MIRLSIFGKTRNKYNASNVGSSNIISLNIFKGAIYSTNYMAVYNYTWLLWKKNEGIPQFMMREDS